MNREEILQQAKESYINLYKENVEFYNDLVGRAIGEYAESNPDLTLNDALTLYINTTVDRLEFLSDQIDITRKSSIIEASESAMTAISSELFVDTITAAGWQESSDLIENIDEIVPALEHAYSLENMSLFKELQNKKISEIREGEVKDLLEGVIKEIESNSGRIFEGVSDEKILEVQDLFVESREQERVEEDQELGNVEIIAAPEDLTDGSKTTEEKVLGDNIPAEESVES
ncbi:MAG: hypothetical protein DGJ47_000974 [Rickettsiaceae bacterium]